MGDNVSDRSPIVVTKAGDQFRIHYTDHPPIIKDPRYRLYVVVYEKKGNIEECTLCFCGRDVYDFSTAKLDEFDAKKDEVKERLDNIPSFVMDDILRQLPSEVCGLLKRVFSL